MKIIPTGLGPALRLIALTCGASFAAAVVVAGATAAPAAASGLLAEPAAVNRAPAPMSADLAITSPAPGSSLDSGGSVLIAGTGAAGATVTVSEKQYPDTTVLVQPDGQWSLDRAWSWYADGVVTITAVQQTPEGFTSVATTDLRVLPYRLTVNEPKVNQDAKWATLRGTGAIGATITITGGAETVTTSVGNHHEWAYPTVPLNAGVNHLVVTQTIHGDIQSKSLEVTLPPQPALTARLISKDDAARTVTVGGNGAPDATITATGPLGDAATTVPADGQWELTISGLAAGENTISVNQTANGETSEPITLTVIIGDLETPVVDPVAAGAVGLLTLTLPVISRTRRGRAHV